MWHVRLQLFETTAAAFASIIAIHLSLNRVRYSTLFVFECQLVNLHIGSSNAKYGSSNVAVIYRPHA